jgi:choline dehydrogenase-like flavoprotein
MNQFDYIIVGAGSAGCALASRLSEDAAVSVCLLEAGPVDSHPLIHLPIGFSLLSENKTINWRFETVPQEQMNGRRGYHPRGRVLGGSSSINAMVYIRGTAADYDRWAEAGATGWSYRDVLPYFRKSQDQERGENEFHGTGGPLSVTDLRYKNPLSHMFIEAARQLGLPANDDFNGASQEGVGFYQVTQRAARRCSAAAAYLAPARDRSNLAVVTGAQVEKIVFDGKRAVGVQYHDGNRKVTVSANREVLLSAGALQSPQLLMLSGIGPAAHLKEHGIEVVHDAPGVGDNLQDHFDYTAIRRVRSSAAMGYTLSRALRAIPDYVRYLRKEGPFTSNLAEAGGFLRTSDAETHPDIQLHFVPGIVDDHGRKKHFVAGISCHVCVLRPASRGTVTLRDANPRSAPNIDPRFLSAGDDLDRTLKGAKLVHRLLDAPAFEQVAGRSMYIGSAANDEELIEDLRNRGDTIYHPVGTCRMGSDAAAVIDPSARVRGVEALRVVDASIMPTLVSGNTNAPAIMIAEKVAAAIRSDARPSG